MAIEPQLPSRAGRIFEFDDKDEARAREIRKDPTATVAQIAKRTQYPISTVAKRYARLKSKGIMYLHVDLQRFFAHRAIIEVDLHATEINANNNFGYCDQHTFVTFLRNGLSSVKHFRNYMESVVVHQVTILLGGRSDIHIVVSAKDVQALTAFLTKVLHSLPGVVKTNTATIGYQV